MQSLELNNEKLKTPIFIGGEGRSGTRLLRSILGKHNNIFEIPRETYIFGKRSKKINNLYKALIKNNDFETLTLSILTSCFFRKDIAIEKSIKNDFDNNAKQLLTELKHLRKFKELTNEYDCFNLCANYLTLKAKKKRWVEKTPSNIYNISLIKESYPKAKIIIIYRDPRAVCFSWQKKETHKSTLASALSWMRSITKMIELEQAYSNNIYTIKYEDLITNSENELKNLCNFINEDFDTKMLDEIKVVNSYFPDSKDKAGLDTAPINRWKKGLSAPQILFIDLITNNKRKKVGYETTSIKLTPTDIFSLILFSSFEPIKLMMQSLRSITRK